MIIDAFDINNAGQILARGCTSRTNVQFIGCRTVLLDSSVTPPIPEPTSLSLMALGVWALVWRQCRA